MNREVPVAFDWVAARAKCNVHTVFDELREVVQHDVEQARQLDIPVDFRQPGRPTCFAVHRENGGEKAVLFERADDTINILNADTAGVSLRFSCRISLVSGHDCMLTVDDEPLRLWQISRLALEALLFPNG